MIQIPSAAGFIPSESVLDGITRLYNTFSPDARATVKAKLAETQAQAQLLGAEAGAVPERTAQTWTTALPQARFIGNQADAVPVETANKTKITDMELENNPLNQSLKSAATAAEVSRASTEAQGQQSRSELNQAQFGLDTQKTNAEIQQMQAEKDYKQKLLEMEGGVNTAKAQELQAAIHNQTADQLFKLYQMQGADTPMRQQYEYGILKNTDPDIAKIMVESMRQKAATANATLQRVHGSIGVPNAAPAPATTPGVVVPPVPAPQVESSLLPATLPTLPTNPTPVKSWPLFGN